MQTNFVMTVMAADRPGVVESVSRVIEDHGGNWLESRMARLAGQFAGILRVEVQADRADALIAALRGLESAGLHLQIESGAAEAAEDAPPSCVQLELIGHDRPGIVHHITEALAAQGINIDEFATRLTATPMSGGQMFTADARLQVPAGVSLDDLRVGLERIAADLMVDVSLCEDV